MMMMRNVNVSLNLVAADGLRVQERCESNGSSCCYCLL
jgi:hypothetical protein